MKQKHKAGLNTSVSAPSFFRWIPRLFWLALLGSLVLGFWWFPFVLVTQQHNGRFLSSGYTMVEDDPSDPRLQALRRREKLDAVVASGQTEFEKIVLLRHWTHRQWKSGGDFFYPPWDAVEILDLARHYDNRGFCAQYAIVFLQACQALGLHARYVELPGHFIVGVWSDDDNRWVVMDPFNDWHYLYKGRPASGKRVCEAYWANRPQDIQKVTGDGSVQNVTRDDLAIYRMYSIVQRSNQLTSPPKVKVNSGPLLPLAHHADYRSYPLVGRDRVAIASPYLAWKEGENDYGDKPISNDPDDFSYPMNQTLIFIARQDPAQALVKILLWHENTPNFENFMTNFDDAGWHANAVREVFWTLKAGMNTLFARVHTKYGWEGPTASIHLFYKPRHSF